MKMRSARSLGQIPYQRRGSVQAARRASSSSSVGCPPKTGTTCTSRSKTAGCSDCQVIDSSPYCAVMGDGPRIRTGAHPER